MYRTGTDNFDCHFPATLVTAILFHQLFEGLSLGVRIAGLPSSHDAGSSTLNDNNNNDHNNNLGGVPNVLGRTLKPALATAFAVTTPIGIVIGLTAFSSGGHPSAGRTSFSLPYLLHQFSNTFLI